MRVKLFVGLLVILALATLAALAIVTSKRSAPVTRTGPDVRSVGSFHNIEVSGLAEIVLRQGSRETLTVEGAQRTQYVDSEIRNETLTINAAQGRHWADWFGRGSGAPTPRIIIEFVDIRRLESAGAVKWSAKRLRADDLHVELAGACSLRIDDLQATKLVFEGSGAINAQLAGKVGLQELELSGAGSYDAANLVTDSTVVESNGAAKAIVNAKTSLRVDLSGAAVVEYLGDPKVEQQVSGISKVRRRDAS
jgi:hypothetical protein